jgi:hypothetical protein
LIAEQSVTLGTPDPKPLVIIGSCQVCPAQRTIIVEFGREVEAFDSGNSHHRPGDLFSSTAQSVSLVSSSDEVRGEFRKMVIELPVIVNANLILQLGIRNRLNAIRAVIVLVRGVRTPEHSDDL